METAPVAGAKHKSAIASIFRHGVQPSVVSRWLISPGTGLAITLFALQVTVFEILRLFLYIRNRDLSAGTDLPTILRAFLVGLRFDMAVASYVMLPLMLFAKLAALRWGVLGERRLYV